MIAKPLTLIKNERLRTFVLQIEQLKLKLINKYKLIIEIDSKEISRKVKLLRKYRYRDWRKSTMLSLKKSI